MIKLIATENKSEKMINEFKTLKYDAVFKTVLVNDKFKPLMNEMLSDILEEPVELIEYLLPEMPVQNFKSKSNRLDVVASTKEGKIINIELNTNHSKYIKLRNLLFYTAMYTQTIEIGAAEKIENIKTVQINLNFNEGKNIPLKRLSHIRYDDTYEIYSDSFEIVDVNVDKYKNLWYHKNISGDLNHIYIVMLGSDEEELIELGKQDNKVEEVKDIMIRLNKNGTFTRTISQEQEDAFFMRMQLNDARDEGKEAGILEEKKNTVKNLLNKNISLEDIIEITGLTKEKIKEIQKSLQEK